MFLKSKIYNQIIDIYSQLNTLKSNIETKDNDEVLKIQKSLIKLAVCIYSSENNKTETFKQDNYFLDLNIAKEIAHFVEELAREKGEKIVVCISNSEGNPILIHRMDDAFLVSFDLARTKAFTSSTLKMSTVELGELTKAGGDLQGLEDMISEKIVTLGGGYPIMANNHVIGGIGVSGSTSKRDHELAYLGSQYIERNIRKGEVDGV